MKTVKEKLTYLMLLCLEKEFSYELNSKFKKIHIYKLYVNTELIFNYESYYEGNMVEFEYGINIKLDALIQKVEDYGI